MRSRVPVLVGVCLLLVSLPLLAEYRPVRGSVVVFLKSTTDTEDPEFRSLMLSVIRVEVEDRELEMVESEALPPEGARILDAATQAGVEFAIDASYTMGDQEVSFDLTWYDVAAKTKAATVSGKSALDFTLDVSIASVVVEALDEQKDRISALPLKPDPNAVQETTTPPAEAPPATVELGKDVVRLERVRPFLFSAGVQPLISTFAATNYLTDLYFGAKAAVAWRFPLGGGAGGIGITSSYQRYRIENVGHPGVFNGIPVGGQVQYGTRMPGPLDFFFHADGGVLIWYLDRDDSVRNNGVSWYILGGVGLVVDVFSFMGIGIDVTYAYYYGYPPLTILEPSVMLLLKL
jgi:hypothetical protein